MEPLTERHTHSSSTTWDRFLLAYGLADNLLICLPATDKRPLTMPLLAVSMQAMPEHPLATASTERILGTCIACGGCSLSTQLYHRVASDLRTPVACTIWGSQKFTIQHSYNWF